MFTCVCLSTGGCLVPGGAWSRGGACSGRCACSGGASSGGCLPRGCLLLGGWGCLVETPRTATAAAGTHPTGMHSCIRWLITLTDLVGRVLTFDWPENSYKWLSMRNFQSECPKHCQRIFSQATIVKLSTDQSEVSAVPEGCYRSIINSKEIW